MLISVGVPPSLPPPSPNNLRVLINSCPPKTILRIWDLFISFIHFLFIRDLFISFIHFLFIRDLFISFIHFLFIIAFLFFSCFFFSFLFFSFLSFSFLSFSVLFFSFLFFCNIDSLLHSCLASPFDIPAT